MRPALGRLCLLALFVVLMTTETFAQCAVKRWSVKTGTDADKGVVDLVNTTATSIATMRSWPAPNAIPANNRVAPYETSQWVLNATLTQYKLESNSDYHLVLKDAAGNTIIAEIPTPNCVGAGSVFAAGIARTPGTSSMRTTPRRRASRPSAYPSRYAASACSISSTGKRELRRMGSRSTRFSTSCSTRPAAVPEAA